MHPLYLIMIFLFVAMVSIRPIYKQYKKNKNEKQNNTEQYRRRLNINKPTPKVLDEQNDYITKYNSSVDYREPNIPKEDYSDWN